MFSKVSQKRIIYIDLQSNDDEKYEELKRESKQIADSNKKNADE